MSEHSRPHLMGCPACIEESDAWVASARFRAAMTAMVRFMTWVWMEADAVTEQRIVGGTMMARRETALVNVLRWRPWLALRWPDE